MFATIRSRNGRLHIAERQAPYWLADCGTVLIHTTDVARAVSPAELVTLDDTVCAYCRAIGRAVRLAEARATEAVLDAGRITP